MSSLKAHSLESISIALCYKLITLVFRPHKKNKKPVIHWRQEPTMGPNVIRSICSSIIHLILLSIILVLTELVLNENWFLLSTLSSLPNTGNQQYDFNWLSKLVRGCLFQKGRGRETQEAMMKTDRIRPLSKWHSVCCSIDPALCGY